MIIITTRTDISTWACHTRPDVLDACGTVEPLVEALLALDHPAFGADWAEWLDGQGDRAVALVLAAEQLAGAHAASPEVEAAGGAVPDDAGDFEDATIAEALADNGVPATAQTIASVRRALRAAFREMAEARESAA